WLLFIPRPAEQTISQDRETIGQLRIELADQGHQRFCELIELIFAEARLPAFLDCAEKWSPYLLSLPATRRGANQPVASRRFWPRIRWVRRDFYVPPSFHAIQVGSRVR